MELYNVSGGVKGGLTAASLFHRNWTIQIGLVNFFQFKILDSTITQHYCWVMIPSLVDIGNPSLWPVLPPGIHDADFSEIKAKFAHTPHRAWLLDGAIAAARALKAAGCQTLYLDGSFTTGKPVPGDYDACWEPTHVDAAKLDPVLLNFDNKRAAQKQKFRGELFIHSLRAKGQVNFLDFFQIDKDSGKPKGIIRISLLTL